MMNVRHVAVLLAVALLAACNGGAGGGGGAPASDSLTGMMLEPNPIEGGEIDDSTGTQIP